VLLCEVVLPDGAGPGRGAWRWYALGALCGLALLSKYTAALLPVQILATALLLPRGRAALRTPHPYLAVVVALAVFSPVIVWNARNGWASFAFQTAARASDSDGFRLDLLGRYLALQVVAVGPLTYVALLVAAWRLARRWDEARARLLLVASVPGIVIFTLLSPWTFVKMNWVAPCYLGLVIALAGLLEEAWGSRRARSWGVAIAATGAALTLVTHAVPLADAIPFPSRDALMNGWRELAAAVDAVRDRRPDRDPVVIAWGYKTASELAFYLRGQPETQANPGLGGTALAYDAWMEDLGTHGDAIVVVDDRYRIGGMGPDALLGLRCAEVEPLAPVTVHRGSRKVTTFRLWWCGGWRDPRRWPLTAGGGRS
jgi:4-amino-4-deoxy-L-arabinose transferase-like glycosyltransferase